MTVTAAQADRFSNESRVYGQVLDFPLFATHHVYRNTLAFAETSATGVGYVIQYASYASTTRFIGVHQREVHNATTALEQLYGTKCQVALSGTLVVDMASTANITIGMQVYATDDHTVQTSNSSAIYVGWIMRVVNTTQVEIVVDTSKA